MEAEAGMGAVVAVTVRAEVVTVGLAGSATRVPPAATEATREG